MPSMVGALLTLFIVCRCPLQGGVLSISERVSDFPDVTELIRVRAIKLHLNTPQCLINSVSA